MVSSIFTKNIDNIITRNEMTLQQKVDRTYEVVILNYLFLKFFFEV